ncbi:hypothetical protein R1flu_027692 [Riccia fluitans]|uniref:Uncharacterized protein n=1 Tax=Riccia fluitans TaxID=41844 RepID=A0ABD1XK24_9MARC
MDVVTSMRGAVILLSVSVLLLVTKCEASEFSRTFCDEWHRFEQIEDFYFLEMLDNLLAQSKSSTSGPVVVARDSEGKYVGRAGCVWHNCQIYDGECYTCTSTRDAGKCIETVITDMKHSIQHSYRYDDRYCHRSKEFSSGEKSIPVDDASTTFQVCGVEYKYLGGLSRRAATAQVI